MEAFDKGNNPCKPYTKPHALMIHHARIKCLEKDKMAQCIGSTPVEMQKHTCMMPVNFQLFVFVFLILFFVLTDVSSS